MRLRFPLLPLAALIVSPFVDCAETGSLHKQGMDYFAQKNYTEAIVALEKAVSSEDPKSVAYSESALSIGQSYFSLKQPEKAISWLERTPGSADASYLLGISYLQIREGEKAEVAFSQLFAVPPVSAAAHLLSAELMLKHEYRDFAFAQVQKALELDPKLPGVHLLLGEFAALHSSLDEAIAEMSKEIAINPNSSMAWYRMGEILVRQQKWAAAIPHLQRAIWLNGDFSAPYIALGRCHFKTGDFSNAEGVLRHAVTIDPSNYAANYLLGQTLMAEDKKDEGTAILEKAKGMQHKEPPTSPKVEN